MKVTTVHQIQTLVRGRRQELGQTQERTARKAGVSRKWLSDFERGATVAAELPLVLRLLTALGLRVDITDDSPSAIDPSPEAEPPTDLDDLLERFTTGEDGRR